MKTFDPLCYEALVLSYLYPRIDAHVSTSINHLLKAPFCVHPKTGNVCVPFDPMKYADFKLADVPTLTRCINELGQTGGSVPCMEKPLEIFKRHIRTCVDKQHKSNVTDGAMEDDETIANG